MPTTAINFYPSGSEQDFTASGELDIRKLAEVVGPVDETTIASFSTPPAEIVLDPYSTRSAVGLSDAANYGWAINRLGPDGMGSEPSAKRMLPAGTWAFYGRFSAALAVTGSYRLRGWVYKVSSTGTRTLLFGPVNTNAVSPNVVGVDVAGTSSQPQFLLEADETLLVCLSVEKTNPTFFLESVALRLNDTVGNAVAVSMPAPGVRTKYYRAANIAGGPIALLRNFKVRKAFAVAATPLGSFARRITARRAFIAAGAGSVAASRKTFRKLTVAATASGKLAVTISEAILERMGSGTAVKRILAIFDD